MCPPTFRLEVGERMLADQLDYMIGVDPQRDWHAIAVVEVVSGAVVFEATVGANSEGYAQALELVDQCAAGRRAFAVEGTGSFGAGLTRFLSGRGEQVLESAGCGGSAARAARPTRSTLSGRPGVSESLCMRPEGGWGIDGLGNTGADIVAAARAALQAKG